MLIGLSGYAQTGKDSTADILIREFGFKRVAFADLLREALYALNPSVGITDDGACGDPECCGTPSQYPMFYRDLIDAYGYEGARKTEYKDEIRRLLQRMGTEVGRKLFGEDFWVEQTFKDLHPGDDVVITDCRFLNEARAVTGRGGEVWRIQRPGVGPANDHISEVGLDDWPFDRYIDNTGTLADLTTEVADALQRARLRFANDIPRS